MNDLQIISLENTDISSWDFDRIRQELQKGLDTYAGLVYTDDSIKDAKNDRASLGKIKKTIEDARKAYKARCLAPYEAVEPRLKELVDMVEQQRTLIDETVKDYENRQKEEKEREVRRYYDRKAVLLGDLADRLYPKLLDKAWLNASATRSKYEEGILVSINRAYDDIRRIEGLHSPFADTLLELYLDTLSLELVERKNKELTDAVSLAGLKTADEAAKESETSVSAPAAEIQPPEKPEGCVTMRVFAGQNQLNQITDFMKAIGVKYELI